MHEVERAWTDREPVPVSPYRQGPPSHPPHPGDVTLRQVTTTLAAFTAALGAVVALADPVDFPLRWSLPATGMVLMGLAMQWAKMMGETTGRRLQHEAWLKSLGATESLDTIAVEVHAPRIRMDEVTIQQVSASAIALPVMLDCGLVVDMTVEVVNGCARIVGQPTRPPAEAHEDWDELTEAVNAKETT